MIDWIVFLLFILFYLGCASRWFVGRLRWFADSKQHSAMLVVILLVPFVLLRLSGAQDNPMAFLQDVGIMVLFLSVPTVATLLRPAKAKSLHWLDVITILALWFPIEFGWLPDADAALADGVNIPIPMLMAICMVLVLFLVIRPLPNIGYHFRITGADWQKIGRGLTAYTLIGIPIGLITRFLILGVTPFSVNDWILAWPLGYLFTALPEELLFRGIIQNQIHDRVKNEWVALLIASFIFGLAHLNNSTIGFGTPNWMYVLMATIAGMAYGWTWRKTGKVTAAAIVHATVNFIWGLFLVG
ncbi:MAG: CPBP family intramembrane metalloprotease [Chloroflexi bacterium]|nr:CPBP family intramembrane metalloprotease [Chloroflexota bacterium]